MVEFHRPQCFSRLWGGHRSEDPHGLSGHVEAEWWREQARSALTQHSLTVSAQHHVMVSPRASTSSLCTFFAHLSDANDSCTMNCHSRRLHIVITTHFHLLQKKVASLRKCVECTCVHLGTGLSGWSLHQSTDWLETYSTSIMSTGSAMHFHCPVFCSQGCMRVLLKWLRFSFGTLFRY